MNEQFNIFIKKFDIKEEKIKLKYDHSLRVQKICEKIAESEKYTKEDHELASLIGLLHDYGRFYQWQKYKTYEDKKSIDHGDYAVERLFENKEIKDFYRQEKNYNIIYEAIKYHNKYEVPKNVESKKMCNLIRDADKLDILYLYTIDIFKLIEEGNITDKIKEDFYNHKLINSKDIKSDIDISLRSLALIYDLNYKYSYTYLKENKIIEKMYKKVKDKEKLKPYFEEINKYIERKIGDKKC
ncbi:MAG: HD domain-containing protein [Bacilli bacterium]|nr:HD domain-containing protein [Bacilli bacterium]